MQRGLPEHSQSQWTRLDRTLTAFEVEDTRKAIHMNLKDPGLFDQILQSVRILNLWTGRALETYRIRR